MSLTHRFLAWLGCFVALVACSDPAPVVVNSAAPEAVTASASSAEPTATVIASASASSPVLPAPPAPVVTTTPIMFEVKKGDVLLGYLFGTMHTGVDAEKELNPIVFRKLDEAKVVVMEADVFNVDAFEIAKTAMYPPGKSVVKDLKPEHWKIVVDRLSSFLLPESSLAQMKPWFIGTMLVQKMLPEVEPIDSVVYKRAVKAGKKLVYVETVKEQLGMVEKSFDVKVLDDMLGDMKKTETMTLELADAYRKGDIEKLTTLTFDAEEMKKHPPMFDLLFFARNEKWIPKLTPLLDQGGVFVAVGAGHLLGDRGVQALLVKKGYSVERIKL
jgi:uncharacterized protein YbaP (TraB family)